MNRQNKTAVKNTKIWQRHALAQACFLVAAGLSTTAWALPDPQDIPQMGSGAAARVDTTQFGGPNTNTSQGLFWATGYNNQIGGYQFGSGAVNATIGSLSLYQQSSSNSGALPVAINDNSFLSYVYGNQQSLARSLSLLNRTSVNSDGQLALNVQVLSASDDVTSNSTQILSSMTGGGRSVYISQSGNASANQSVSGNTFGATTISNLVETSLSGALPFLYNSEFKGQSSLTFTDSTFQSGGGSAAVDASFFRGTRGGVNATNIQSTFNTAGLSTIEDASAKITLAGTPPSSPAAYGVFADNINLNANNILSKSTINSATSIVTASAGSSAFSGSVAVTNGQNNRNTNTSLTQKAIVDNGDVMANLQGGATETRISGSLNVNGNTVSANAAGNVAGTRNSTGTIASGNAIVFEGSSDIKGPIGSKAWDVQLNSARSSLIDSTMSQNDADLLVNSAQRNLGISFLASVNPSEISSTADNLAGGVISQNGNTQSATVSGNLVGNLIMAGNSASIGNILSNAAIVNSQENRNVTGTATVEEAVQKVSVGLSAAKPAVNGTISLNDNTIQATAEGNAAASTIILKASTLSVGQGAGSTTLMTPNTDDPVTSTEYLASSLAAVSVLSAQKNTALTLTSNLENSSVSAEVKIPAGAALSLSASAVSVNGNKLLSNATGNEAGNSVNLTASTAPSLNAAVGNTQFNSGNVLGSGATFAGSSIAANAGNASALSVGFTGKDLTTASSVSLNTNSISATAKGSSATNALNVTADNATGGTESKVFPNNTPSSQANDPNSFSTVASYADLGLANAQAARGTTVQAVVDGSVTAAVAAVNNSGLTANSNKVTADASLNSAINTVALNIGNMSGMSAALASAQTAANSGTTTDSNSKASAQTDGAVSLTTTGAVTNGASLTLASNTVSASASANAVNNTLALTGTTASGRDINVLSEEGVVNLAGASILSDGTAQGAADFSLANKQKIVASSALTVYSADTTSAVKAVVGGNLTASSVTVSDNITSARASGNDASNTIRLAVNDLSKPNTALASMQSMDTATFKATVTDASIYLGTGVSVTGEANSAQVAVTGNQVKASALGNVVTNSVALSGTNLTGSPIAFDQPTVSTSVLNIDASVILQNPVMKSEATVALANMQTSIGSALSAKLAIGTDGDGGEFSPKIGINTGLVSGATSLSVTSNTMATQVYNNSANNSLALDVTNANAVSAGLVSAQLAKAVSGTALDSTTNARIQIESGEVSGASSLSLSLNRITSTTVANVADNTLTVKASTASGRGTGFGGFLPANARNLTTSFGYAHDASADYALVNEQLVMASVLGATTKGEFLAQTNGTGPGSVTNSSITLSNNLTSSFASANNANNLVQLDVTNLSAARAGLTNAQQVENAATVTTDTQAYAAVSTGNLLGAKISANNNQFSSTALGNTATNEVRLAGTNASNSNAFGAVSTRTGSSSDVNADMALASDQSNKGSTLSATLLGFNSVFVGTVANDSSNLSVISSNSNSLLAASTVNSVANTVGLNLQNNLTGMAAGLSSTQTADNAAATAGVSGLVGLGANAVSDNSSVSVNSNTVSASASANTANNTVNVAASTASGRSNYTGAETAVISSTEAKVTADYALANKQSVTGTSKAFDASTDALVGVIAGDVTSSSVTVNANKALASVLGNSANNSVNVAVTNLTLANTGLASVQTLGDTVSFAADVNKNSGGTFGVLASALSGANLTVNNNTLTASAVGNSATNKIEQTVTNMTGTDIANVITRSNAVYPAVFAPSNVALSSLQQSTGNAITAFLGDASTDPTKKAGVWIVSGIVNGASDLFGASSLSVTGNTLSTEVFNNSANNTVALSGTNLTKVSAGLASGQVVTAVDTEGYKTALTATTVASSGISVGGTVGTGAQLTASSNTIKSLVVGNSAGNSLSVNATNASGQNFSGMTASASNKDAYAEFALTSEQVLSGSAMQATTQGAVSIGATGGVTSANLTANGNTVSAYTSANNVSNALNLGINTLTAARAGLANSQTVEGGASVKATVENASVLISSTGDLSAVQASLARNSIKATALGNVADNQFALTGTNATAGTQGGGQANTGSFSYLTTDLALGNLQISSGQTVTAKNGTDAIWTKIALTPNTDGGLVQNTSNLALTANTVSALSYANNATNGMDIGVTNLNGLTAGVANRQSASASAAQAVSAETYGQVYADVDTVQGTSTLTVSNNTVSATSMANYAGNSLQVAAQQITGKGIFPFAEAQALTPSSSLYGDLTLANSQALTGSGDAVTAKVDGKIEARTNDLKNSNATLSSNTISAYAAGNNVGNELLVNTSGLNGVVVALGNAQTSSVNTTSSTTGYINGASGLFEGARMAVNDNQVMSTAVGNAAGNTVNLKAANATGVSTGPYVNLGSSYAEAVVDASLVNTQNLTGSVQAKTGLASDSYSAMVKILINSEAKEASTLSLNGNAVTASAYGNSATNAGSLRISNALSMASAVSNSQEASGASVTSEVLNGAIFLYGYPLTDTNVTVNNNQISSTALVNTASNTLSVSAASATGRNVTPFTSTNENPKISADQMVANVQKAAGGTVSATTAGRVEHFTDSGAVTRGNVSQNANEVTSYASANQATNTLSMAVANSNTATAGIYSVQTLDNPIKVAAQTTGKVVLNTIGTSVGDISTTTLSLNDNQVMSTALGNMANNSLSASGATLQSAGTPSSNTAGTYHTNAQMSLFNAQTSSTGSNGGAVTATTRDNVDNTDPFLVKMGTGSVTDAALSLNNNTIAAQAIIQSATNKLAVNVTNSVGTLMALSNNQEAYINTNATSRGMVVADVVNAGTIAPLGGASPMVSASTIAVNGNEISAKAYTNSADNSLKVAGTNFTGSSISNRAFGGESYDGININADIALTNYQYAQSNITEATVSGGMSLTSNNQPVVGNTLTMNNNAVSAYASGNSGNNLLSIAPTSTLSAASAGLVSTQRLGFSEGSSPSTVTATTTGSVNIATGALGVAASDEPVVLPKSASVSVKDNSITSTALGNVVGNTLAVSASTANSAGRSDVSTTTVTGNEMFAGTSADYSLVNAQAAFGTMSATTTGAVGVTSKLNDLVNETPLFTTVANSSISLTGNAIKSVAQANSASNGLTLTVDQPTGLTAAVVSRQDNAGMVTAETTTTAGALTIAVDSLTQSPNQTLSVVMSGNTVSASAGKNEAFNTLTVSGANVRGRNNAVSGELVGSANLTGVDYSIVNAQAASNGVSASVDVKASGITSTGTVNAGTISLNDNTVSASANANNAINALTLAATNRLEASGAINNVQAVTDSEIKATVKSASLTVDTSSGAGVAAVTSTGNVVKATAFANLATNALNATASNGMTSAGAERGDGMPVEGSIPNPQTPTFAVLNSQHTNSGTSVTAVINGFSMGGSQLSGALNGGSVAVTGNVVQAVAYGNSASNSIQLSTLPATLNTASTSITNVQYNMASVSTNIGNVNVQASGANNSVSSSGVNISGNTVTAMAVGNRAVNIITGR